MKIIFDTNIVFSTLLNSNGRIGNLLLDTRGYFEFYSCKYLQKELFRHLPKIKKYTKLRDEELFELLTLIESRIFFIDEELLSHEILVSAKELVSDIDYNDLAFVALTGHLDGLLWTGDKELIEGLTQKGYRAIISTHELSTLLEKLKQCNKHSS